jgi:hypothetical protein
VEPSIEIRGGALEYYKYNDSWLMKWVDQTGSVKYYPLAMSLGIVSISQDVGYAGTLIYTVSSIYRDPISMMKNSSWWCPAGLGPLTAKTNSGSRNWTGLTASSNVLKQAACSYGGYIWTSVDTGSNWTQRASSLNWSCIAGDQTGTYLIAGVYGGYLWVSADSGATWSQKASSKNWISVAISSDGTKMVGAVWGGTIWYSSDSGSTWTERTSMPTNYNLWVSMACSSDLSVMYVCEWKGTIIKSTDYGVTWTTVNSLIRKWKMLSCSGSGTSIIAASSGVMFLEPFIALFFPQRFIISPTKVNTFLHQLARLMQ